MFARTKQEYAEGRAELFARIDQAIGHLHPNRYNDIANRVFDAYDRYGTVAAIEALANEPLQEHELAQSFEG